MGPARRRHGSDDLVWDRVVRCHEIRITSCRGPDRVWDSLVEDWGIFFDAAYRDASDHRLALASP
jgi:hypothetical protein